MATASFVQQITVIKSAAVTVGTASLHARSDYPNLEFSISEQFENPLGYGNIPDFVTASIYQGIYAGGNLTDVYIRNALQEQPSCPTGNCTYDEFDSLAVCNACANITDFLISEADLAERPNKAWIWALPNNFSVGDFPDSGSVVSTGAAYHPLLLQAGLPIVNVTAIQPCVRANGNPCAATAQECMLHWCVNRYRSKVVNGIFYENITETVKYGYTINPDLLEDDTYVFHTNFTSPQAHSVGNGTYDTLTVSKWGSAALTDLIAQLLTVNVSSLALNGSTDIYHGTASLSSTFPGIPLDMTPVFEAMAVSMSTAIRSNRNYLKGLRTFAGQVTKEVPFIRVRWAWISVPAVLQVAVLILLCYTMVSTSRQQLPIWKNSILATIFVGARVHRSLREEMSSDRLIDMKTAAENVKVGQCQIFVAGHVHNLDSCVGSHYQSDE